MRVVVVAVIVRAVVVITQVDIVQTRCELVLCLGLGQLNSASSSANLTCSSKRFTSAPHSAAPGA